MYNIPKCTQIWSISCSTFPVSNKKKTIDTQQQKMLSNSVGQ
jgi:hypothetical protein